MKKLYPDNPYEYVVYHDDFLLELGRKLWYDFSINNELEVSQTSNASRQIVRNALPDNETRDSILNYLGINILMLSMNLKLKLIYLARSLKMLIYIPLVGRI